MYDGETFENSPSLRGYNPKFVRDVWAKRREAERRRIEEERRAAAELRRAEAELREMRQIMEREMRAKIAEVAILSTRNGLRRHTYRAIERRACMVFGVTRADLHGNRRQRKIAFARQFVMYWCTRLCGLSLPQIGNLMGGKDHTTVLHGKRQYPVKRAAMGRHLKALL
jgi:chromosomal replication initiation ATPase DnaA